MRQETRSCGVGMSVEELWSYLADYDQVVRLSSPGGSGRLIDGEPGRAGAKYRATVLWEGITSEFTARLASAEPPSSLMWKAASGSGCGSIRFDLRPAEAGTRVDATLEFAATAPSRALEPFAWGLIQPMFKRMMRKLHELAP